MTMSAVFRPPVRAAFGALIDYAGLFPPARLSLDDARSEYGAARSGERAWVLGRFIIPASLLAAAESFDAPLSVIADEGETSLPSLARRIEGDARVEALEIPPAVEMAQLRSGLGERVRVPVFVEIPPSNANLEATMRELARDGYGAKMRCGGVTAEAFPRVDEVADFIAAAHAAGVPFKATAGLHHPVRHRDASSGFMMHGFLNVLAAAALAPRVDRGTLARIVAEEDASAFTFDDARFRWRDDAMDAVEIARTRRDAFVAYGSCSFTEPVDDLAALGILPPR